MNFLLLGASGGVGRRVLAQGRARSHTIRAQTRDAARLADQPPGIEVVVADPTAVGTLRALVAGQEAVIISLRWVGRTNGVAGWRGARQGRVGRPLLVEHWRGLVPSVLFNSIAKRTVSGSPLCCHSSQQRNRLIDIVDNENVRLSIILAVQAADILGQGASPGDRHGQE